MSLLAIQSLSKRFGGLLAVDDVGFAVEEREIFSVIGPNGAGKSTLFKLITGFLRPTAGRVQLAGEELTGHAPHTVARRGVVRTFQETTIFREMSALDNVVVAHHLQGHANLAGFYFGSRRARESEVAFRKQCARDSGLSRAGGGGRRGGAQPARTAICARWGWRSRWPPSRAWCCSMSRSPG